MQLPGSDILYTITNLLVIQSALASFHNEIGHKKPIKFYKYIKKQNKLQRSFQTFSGQAMVRKEGVGEFGEWNGGLLGHY